MIFSSVHLKKFFMHPYFRGQGSNPLRTLEIFPVNPVHVRHLMRLSSKCEDHFLNLLPVLIVIFFLPVECIYV